MARRVSSKNVSAIFIVFFLLAKLCCITPLKGDTTYFCKHRVVLDDHGKILPWYSPSGKAYDNFIRSRWNFIKTNVPSSPGPLPRSLYPQYYFYCAFKDQNGTLQPDTWMNDTGEKLPNWFESARLYYSYTGDSSVMKIVKDLTDYYLAHGLSRDNFAWPHFPYTTTNAGDTLFLGFTSAGRFKRHEVQVDHAGEIGLTYLRMFQYFRDEKYLKAAIGVADVLAKNATDGNGLQSAWPYRVIMNNGKITAPYGANWTGCYQLLQDLCGYNKGSIPAYTAAMEKARKFLLEFPMKTGYWTDGHSDNNVKSNTYKSNLSASNMALFLLDHPEFDPDWKSHIPMLIKWSEDYFVDRCAPGEPSAMWGANIVGEQDSFLYKMDYQTARYAAECARWYCLSGDEAFREKAFRSLNWVTYCSDSSGMAFESPVSKGILSWWSDSYGECPRMFYQAFSGMPELAPQHENHILYSPGILRNVSYSEKTVGYSASEKGTEYLRIAFKPLTISINQNLILQNDSLSSCYYRLRSLGEGDYFLVIIRGIPGNVTVSGQTTNPGIDITNHPYFPVPAGWYSGDIHIHRNCGEVTAILPESQLAKMMEPNDLSVISLLADMGNGEVKDSKTDLPKVTGGDAMESVPGRIIHWDAEWHFDPAGVTFEKKAIGGHLVFLGLKEAHQIWSESPYKIIQWAKAQGALAGFCHMQYLTGSFPEKLDCCTPLDFPVEAALGTIDFLAEDVWLNDASVEAYYKLLNCGFRLGWAAGTDYPCNGGDPFGSLLTWVNLKGKPLSYRNWIDGIKHGRTVISTCGNSEFLDIKVNRDYTPGDELFLGVEDSVDIEVTWTSARRIAGRIELILNGNVVDILEGSSEPSKPLILKTRLKIRESSWLCSRRMNVKGHQSHTSPIYITLRHQPVRASADDARYYISWIDKLLERIKPGGPWNIYFNTDYKDVESRYIKARQVFVWIADEAERKKSYEKVPVLLIGGDSGYGSYTSEILKAEGLNLYKSVPVNSPLISSAFLRLFKVIILPPATIKPDKLDLIKNYANEGGNVISFMPDKYLDAVFGISSLKNSSEKGYIGIDTTKDLLKGLTGSRLRLHVPARLCSLSTGTKMASLFTDLEKKAQYPAVVLNRYGKGKAAAFLFNLPENILLTRQGNPESAGKEKDGIPGVRAMDLFTDGWIDSSLNTVNQADEQMRLVSWFIEWFAGDSIPLPKLWYFPDTFKCAVVLTNDGESRNESDFEIQFREIDSVGAKMTLYVLKAEGVSEKWAARWHNKGFEISGHPDDTREADNPSWSSMKSVLDLKKKEISARYGVPMKTVANHWFVWCGKDSSGRADFASQAEIESAAGIRLDMNYAHYDNNSIQPHFLGPMGYNQGNFTGSGLPMRFAERNGNVLNIFQLLTNVYDQQYMENNDEVGFFDCFRGLLERSLKSEVFSVIGIKAHNDEYGFSRKPLLKMLALADSMGIPVWTAENLLSFIEQRDASAFEELAFDKDQLSFIFKSPGHLEENLCILIPAAYRAKKISGINVNRQKVNGIMKIIKGRSFEMVTIRSGMTHVFKVRYG